MAQDSAHGLSPTGQPADAAATSPDSPVTPTATPRRPALSPSRAADFKTCPLLYRFRTIDRLPERKSLAAVRGTLVHSVLERLYDLPARRRTAEAARELVAPAWEELRADPEVAALFAEGGTGDDAAAEQPPSLEAWLASAGELVETYFSLEDPSRIEPHGREELVERWFSLEDPARLEPAERELYVETTLDDGLVLRGYVDRLDVAPTGEVRVVDYKTGRAPGVDFEARALFQMRFYALVLWRTHGVVPRMLQLVYLGDGQVLRFTPDEAELLATRAQAAGALVGDRARGDHR